MTDITALSKRPVDLLADADTQSTQHSAVQRDVTEGMRTLQLAHRNAAEAPQAAVRAAGHELAGEGSRRVPTIASVVEERRVLGGRPAAEQYIKYVSGWTVTNVRVKTMSASNYRYII
ncbi:hypothetical protein AAVH_34047 [Aphelenchoides avenae]|nr:hypothetical protein AAVH_34047 [Aphelenchus avenae]